MDIKLPQKVSDIIHILEERGFEAYAVGGCIRDSIIGTVPSDWDITTSAHPEEVAGCFEKIFATGIQHGTITVLIENEAFEVTTFRTEDGYSDFRRPDNVNFVRNLEDDLKRRDFTINAMAYNPSKGLIDLYGGINDINSRIIRTVGSPLERFSEDALRILRAVRFAARLGFSIETGTADGILHCARLINNISKERIREEISGILMSARPEYLSLLYELKVLDFILPDLAKCFQTPQNNPYHVYDVGKHTMVTLKNSDRDLCVRWALMLHDTGKAYTRTTDSKNIDHFYGHEKFSEEITEKVLMEYKFDNENKKCIKTLVKYHDVQIKPEERAVRRVLNKVGERNLRLLLKVKRADSSGKNPEKVSKGNVTLDKLQKTIDDVIAKKQCTCLKDLKINGADLIQAGIPYGPGIGKVLNALLQEVIDKPELNNKDYLLAEAKVIYLEL